MITLLHPSRGRPHKSFNNITNWLSKAGVMNWGQHIEIILSLDSDDNTVPIYQQTYGAGSGGLELATILINPNQSVVEATNHAAKASRGDILVYLSDDFDCPKDWAVSLEARASTINRKEWLMKVDDCLQQFHVPVLTIPIMSRGLYEKLGYFWHPGYRSMFVDEDLYWTCDKLGCMVNAPDLKFPHLHCSVGKAERDMTYIRSEKNWDSGKAFFAQRKAAGFPI